SKYNTLCREVTENLDKFELGVAVSKLYDFIWDNFCDWYIELVKPRLFDMENPTGRTAQYVLTYVLSNTMKLLHPFMPFITEEIWQHLPHSGESIVISDYPKYSADLCFPEEEKDMEIIMKAVSAIRLRRNEMNVPPSKKAKLIIVTDKQGIFAEGKAFFEKLASASETVIQSTKDNIDKSAVNIVVEAAEIFIPMGELIDKDKELERLLAEKKRLEAEIDRVNKKLSNEGFVAKAPQKVIDEEKEKGEKYYTYKNIVKSQYTYSAVTELVYQRITEINYNYNKRAPDYKAPFAVKRHTVKPVKGFAYFLWISHTPYRFGNCGGIAHALLYTFSRAVLYV
ncbi:MAG: class I tRNA ligase family protein, partial [Clostridia bacterium]|nr:class I tRNA ligase family protein [Clostridia bacterium]